MKNKLSIRIVEARSSKERGLVAYKTTNEYSIQGDIRAHKREADIIQGEVDNDGDPARVYVCSDGVPIYAGGQLLV